MDSTNSSFLITWIVIGICITFAQFFKWLRGTMYEGKERLDGKTVVITGANTGIGKETALGLASRGARLYLLCRNINKAENVANTIRKKFKTYVKVIQLDLSSFKSIKMGAKSLLQQETKIHILINNAGVCMTPKMETVDGFEMQFGTNHLGHFQLTHLLLDALKSAAPSRIVTVSALAHAIGKIHWDDINLDNNYGPLKAYTQSKLANILFSKYLAKELQGTGVTTYCLHPGIVLTELIRHLPIPQKGTLSNIFNRVGTMIVKTPQLGAQTSIYCAVNELLEYQTGKYYSGFKESWLHPNAHSAEDAKRLWIISEKMVGIS